MPFGKHVLVRSFGYGVCLAELSPIGSELPDGVTSDRVEDAVRKAVAEHPQGELQGFERCAVREDGIQRWAALFSHGHPTSEMELGMLDEDAVRDLASAAAKSPPMAERMESVLAAADRLGGAG